MRNPIGEDLGGVQESRRTHLARPQPAVGGGLIALRAIRRAEFGIAVYCVAELPKRRTCVILGPAFLHRVNYSGIGTHLHEDEPVLF